MGTHEARAEASPPAAPRQGLPPARRRYRPRRISRIAAYVAAIQERSRTLSFDVEEQIRDRHEALRGMAQERIRLEDAALDALIAGADWPRSRGSCPSFVSTISCGRPAGDPRSRRRPDFQCLASRQGRPVWSADSLRVSLRDRSGDRPRRAPGRRIPRLWMQLDSSDESARSRRLVRRRPRRS